MDDLDLDLDLVRAQFPAFAEPSLQGWVHAQNAGGSYACRQVIDRLTTFYRSTRLQGGGHFPAGAAAAAAIAAARPGLARWLGVAEDEVHVGPSTTQNTYVLGHALAEVLSPGDAVVVTNQDHEANSGAWRRLADRGHDVREWQVDAETGRLDLADLDALLDDDVALVAFPHVSNLVGEPNPVAEIAARAHAVGALAVADGVAAAPHGLPDVGALGVDVYLLSAYKTFGPHQGVMVVRRELVDRLPNQGHFFNADDVHKKLVPAGPDHAQVAALAGVAAYLDLLAAHRGDHDLDMPERRAALNDAIRAHEADLLTPLLAVVADRPGVRVLGPTDPAERVPTLSLTGPRPSAQLAVELAEAKVMASHGHFYAHRLVEAVGLDPADGVLRISLVHYNTADEVAQLVDGLDRVLGA